MGTLYKNIGGTYQDAKGVDYPNGALVESDDDLIKKFVNHFEKVHVADAPVPQAPAPAPVVVTDADDEDEVLPEGHTDVTEEFPAAVDGDLRVTRDKAGWWVHDGDEIQNEKALKKKDVVAYITEYVEGK